MSWMTSLSPLLDPRSKRQLFSVLILSVIGLSSVGAGAAGTNGAGAAGTNGARAASKGSEAAGRTSALTQLQNKIDQSGAGWTAAESPVTRMQSSEWPSLLGLNPNQAPDVQFDNHRSESSLEASTSHVRTESISSLDWRSHNGANWVSPILDQGQCGSCVAFSSIGTMETQMRIESGYPDFNIQLSTQYIFSCGGGSCSLGWEPLDAAKFLKQTGAVDDACMPYTSANASNTSCRKACGDSISRRVRIADYSVPTNSEHNIAAVKAALKNGPLVTTMNIYQDFMYYAGGVYKHVTGKRIGAHAISIVGYSDRDRAWIVRNSWGPAWGELGFFRISYDDGSGLSDSTWGYQIQPFKGISLDQPSNGFYASKTVKLQTHSTITGTKSVRAQVYSSANKVVLSRTLASTGTLDLTALATGRYEINAEALGSNGQILASSERHYFFVSANSAPSLASVKTFDKTPDTTGALTLNLQLSPLTTSKMFAETGVKDLKIEANIGDQEITSATFHFRKAGADSASEVVHTTEHVLNGATIHWRTDALPKGSYEYWLSGQLTGSNPTVEAETPHQLISIGM